MFEKTTNLKIKCGNRTELVKKSYKVMETNVWEKSTTIKNSKKENIHQFKLCNSSKCILVSTEYSL